MLKSGAFLIDVWNLGFDQFQGAFLSTGFLAPELALLQQFVDDAGSLDGKTQAVVQSAKVPLDHCNITSLRPPWIALMMWRCNQCQPLRMTGTSCIKRWE